MQPMRGQAGQLFLKYFARFLWLRRVPFLRDWLHQLSYRILPADAQIWIQIRSGVGKDLWLELNPRTGREYYEGSLELAVQQALCNHLFPGMVFYDIGANIGFFTLVAARLLGEKGKVFAFEADPDAARRLRENVQRNLLRNVVVLESAVWSTTGEVVFLRSDPTASPDRGLGRVAAQADQGENIVVTSLALDDFIATAPPPDFIKCDAEGAEEEIFRGAKDLLALYKPGIICECHSLKSLRPLRELFDSLGYEVSLVNSNHLLALPS